ncbi:hypothetical protein V2J09_002555 [Rumex salicifolius]
MGSSTGKNLPMIIAMQGDAYTGKTFLAEKLAFRLKCPLICLDDILDSSEPTDQLDALIFNAFVLIAQIVKTQISLGLSVVVDSPLSRLSHLHKLVSLIVSRGNTYKTRLLIIECKPNNEYAWQMRFEEIDSSNYAKKWYKPVAEWPLPKLPRDYTDDNIPPMVSKLVVNTTDYYSACQMLIAVFDITYCGNRHVGSSSVPPALIRLSMLGMSMWHKVTVYKQEGVGVDHDTCCGVCENQVTNSGASYTCEGCSLTLHRSCAELARGDNEHFKPGNFPGLLSMEPNVAYAFPVECPCVRCREDGKDFSDKCRHCLFESHLKSRLVPTVVRHKAHGHFLTLWLHSNCDGYMYSYTCMACRKRGGFVAYICGECNSRTYHPECLLLPPSVDHSHGGYTHELQMVLGREEEMEDYICDLCQNKMDPKAWYYHCGYTHELHLECAFKDFD